MVKTSPAAGLLGGWSPWRWDLAWPQAEQTLSDGLRVYWPFLCGSHSRASVPPSQALPASGCTGFSSMHAVDSNFSASTNQALMFLNLKCRFQSHSSLTLCIFCGCSNKLPPTGWLKTTQMCLLSYSCAG